MTPPGPDRIETAVSSKVPPPQTLAAYRSAGSELPQDGRTTTPSTQPQRDFATMPASRTDTARTPTIPTDGGLPAAGQAPVVEEAGPVFEAVVARNSNSGKPLLQTPFGLMSLENAADLQPGSRISLQTIALPVLPDPFAVLSADAEPTPPFFGLLAFLAGLGEDPLLAAPPGPGTQPPPVPVRLAAALVNLFIMADSGEVRPWLNQTAVLKSLSKHQTLVEELEKDAETLKTRIRMPDGDEWQSILVPLPIGQRIEQIRFMVRRRTEGETAELRQETGTRFLVELNMTRLGALQLDGLMRPKSRRFDLILRTPQPLRDDVRQDISNIFRKSLDGMGMAGNASFQAGQFIEPVADSPSHGSGWVI